MRHSLSCTQARWRRSTRAGSKFADTRLERGAYVWRASQQGPYCSLALSSADCAEMLQPEPHRDSTAVACGPHLTGLLLSAR